MIKTEEEQAQTIANHMPSGRAFGAKNVSGTNIRQFLLGLAKELIRVDALLVLFRSDILPDETEHFIDEWESAVDIPDSCLKGTGDNDERRLHIIAKLARMAIQTNPDFVDLANYFGISVTIESGSIHGAFPYTFPIVFYPDARAAHHTLIINFSSPGEPTFPYTFPIVFGSNDLIRMQCIFNKLKPANVDITYTSL